MAAFIQLDRLKEEIKTTKRNHQDFIDNFLKHLENIRYPTVDQFWDLCSNIDNYKVQLLPSVKPKLLLDEEDARTVEGVHFVVRETKQHLEKCVADLKSVAKKIEQRDLWANLVQRHDSETQRIATEAGEMQQYLTN